MKRTLALVALPFVLAACGGDEVVREKETIVERPVVTERVIVDRPSAAAGTSAPACTYASRGYSAGSVSCQEGREFRCTNGAWERTETFC
jgi:hypothetical protein